MHRFYFGLDRLIGGWDRYLAKYSLLETPQFPVQPITIKRLNSWRIKTPKGFSFLLDVAPEFGNEMAEIVNGNESEISPKLIELWEDASQKAKALAAKGLIIKTPPTFNPSERSRALIQKIAEKFGPMQKGKIFWESSGLWDPTTTLPFATKLGIVYGIDPFLFKQAGGKFLHGDAYFIINERSGARRQFDIYDFEEMFDWSTPYLRTFVVLRGRFQKAHARHLLKLVKEIENNEFDNFDPTNFLQIEENQGH